MAEVVKEKGLLFSINGSNIYKYPQKTDLLMIVLFSPGQPNITEADGLRDLAPDEIASALIPNSTFEDLNGPLSVAVTVFEEPTFFPLPPPTENNTGLETQIGTPVVSVLVARDQEQLQFRDLNPPLVFNLRITEEEVLSFCMMNLKHIHTYIFSKQ